MRKLAVLMIVVGVAILGWLAWTYEYGDPITAIPYHHHQTALAKQLPVTCDNPREPLGSAAFKINIGEMGLQAVVVRGAGEAQLSHGPGVWYGWPGQPVTAIAGHRTTWGHPFFYLNTVHVGNYISLTCRKSVFKYRVYKVQTVLPTAVRAVLTPRKHEQILVLSACTPRYSAAYRLVVFARRV